MSGRESADAVIGRPVRVCLVQPVSSPYWMERLKILAKDKRLAVSVVLEREGFAHRPGWKPEAVEGVDFRVLGSAVVRGGSRGDDLGYHIDGVRSIPWRLSLELWRQRSDIAVLCNATQVLFALVWKYLFRGRLALIIEDTPHSTRNHGWLSRMLKGFLYRRVDGFFAFSADAVSYLHGIGVRKEVVRSSWSLDMAQFCPGPAEDRVDPKVRRRTIIFVGALVNNKGVRHLLDAWRGLPPDVRNGAELLMVGSGVMEAELKDAIRLHQLDEVSLLGQQPYARVRHLLQHADLLVLPTLQDLFSLTVLEAMACGCPVVTTPFNGARELVEPGVNGWVVNPTEEGALTRVLELALSSDCDLAGMGAAARRRVEVMDNGQVMARFGDALRQMAAGECA